MDLKYHKFILYKIPSKYNILNSIERIKLKFYLNNMF